MADVQEHFAASLRKDPRGVEEKKLTALSMWYRVSPPKSPALCRRLPALWLKHRDRRLQ